MLRKGWKGRKIKTWKRERTRREKISKQVSIHVWKWSVNSLSSWRRVEVTNAKQNLGSQQHWGARRWNSDWRLVS